MRKDKRIPKSFKPNKISPKFSALQENSKSRKKNGDFENNTKTTTEKCVFTD